MRMTRPRRRSLAIPLNKGIESCQSVQRTHGWDDGLRKERRAEKQPTRAASIPSSLLFHAGRYGMSKRVLWKNAGLTASRICMPLSVMTSRTTTIWGRM